MDDQAITTISDLERILLDERMEAKRLSLSLLKTITNNFSLEIGRGGFAVVYKGQLEKQRQVAVKQLIENRVDEEKFIGEVNCLMKAKHKNIVRFLGYCSETHGKRVEHNGKFVMADVCQKLLCFEYVPNKSLNDYIKDASRDWKKCYKIIQGVCEGLHYLHKERIVHRDLTPANILLDNDMVPKITDFGISRCFDELQTHDFTSKHVGTVGYLAPEFICNGKITLKSDIYSLGTIITEILTGHRGCLEVEEVKNHWRHKLEGSQKELQLEQIRVCTEVAQRCWEFKPEDRPSAEEVIDILKQTEIEETCIEPGASSHDTRSLDVQGRDCSKSDAAADAATPLGSTVAATEMTKRKRQESQELSALHPEKTVVLQREYENRILGQPMKMLKQAISKLFARDTKDKRQQLQTHRRNYPRIEPFRTREERYREYQNGEGRKHMKMLMQAISKLYAGNMDTNNTEIFLELYRSAYNVVIGNMGEELYSSAENTMASEVQSLCRPLDDAAAPVDNSLFLQELLTKWDLHICALRSISTVFMYMERRFVQRSGKTPIYELGLRLWRDEMARSDKIRQSLIEAVKRQKGGEDELVPGVNKMLKKLGAHVKDKDDMPVLYFYDGTKVEDDIVSNGNQQVNVPDAAAPDGNDAASVRDAGPQKEKRARRKNPRTSGPEWVS